MNRTCFTTPFNHFAGATKFRPLYEWIFLGWPFLMMNGLRCLMNSSAVWLGSNSRWTALVTLRANNKIYAFFLSLSWFCILGKGWSFCPVCFQFFRCWVWESGNLEFLAPIASIDLCLSLYTVGKLSVGNKNSASLQLLGIKCDNNNYNNKTLLINM